MLTLNYGAKKLDMSRISWVIPDAKASTFPHFRLGYLRLLRGDYHGSAEAFQAVLAKQPNWAEASLNAGIAFARSGDPATARQFFTETVMLRPDSSDGVRGLAALALEQNEYEEALELHERLIEMGERSPEVFYNAGLICQKR